MYIDSHAHWSHGKFDGTFRSLGWDPAAGYVLLEGSRESLLEAASHLGIASFVEPAIDLSSSERLLALAAKRPSQVFPAVGLHPTRTPQVPFSGRKALAEYAKRPGVVAIGETGLDFHFPRAQQYRTRQYRWFAWQRLLAHRRRLPLILHIREADREALRVLRLARPLLHGGVAHCFSGGWDTAQAFLKLGLYLGIGGTLLQEGETAQNLAEAVRLAPLDRLLLETDSPYVHPATSVINSGKMRAKVRNTPLILPAVAARIASLKDIDPREVERQTALNAVRLFRLPIDPDTL